MASSAAPVPTLATHASLLGPFRLGRLDDDRLAGLAAAGDERAFEVLYDRHHRALLGFCRHMVRSREEAEDALQQTFLRAHRALAERGPPADMRPWLFAIARNRCLTLLAGRRSEAEVDETVASTEGLGEQVQTRVDLQALLADVERLPDDQRAALVLAELADLSHDQIAEVIGVRTGKVKALVHQARTTLIAERDAREMPCEGIREQLATARGGALRRGPLRRHLRLCAPCRAYGAAVTDQRRALALVLPMLPSVGLKAGVMGAASAAGGAGAAAIGTGVTGASLAGGLAAKVAAGALLLGGVTTGGIAIVDRPSQAPRPAAAAAEPGARPATSAPAAPRLAGRLPIADPSSSSPARAPERSSRRGSRPRKKAGRGTTRARAKARARARSGRPVSRAGDRSRAQRRARRRLQAARPLKLRPPVTRVVPGTARNLPRATPPQITGGGTTRPRSEPERPSSTAPAKQPWALREKPAKR